MMSIVCRLALIAWSGIPVEVDTVDGKVVPAQLEERADDIPRLVGTDANAAPPLSWEQVQAIRFPQNLTPADPHAAVLTTTMALQDGSRTRVESIHIQDGSVRITGAAANLHQFALEHVRAILFRDLDETQRERWSELLTLAQPEDLLIVRKNTGKLDYLAGLVQSVNRDRVQFRYDGQVLDVRLEKLAGVIFPARPPTVRSVATLTHRSGAEWQLGKWRLHEETLSGETTGGISIKVATSDVASLQLQQNAYVYLSDLAPRSTHWQPFVVDSRRAGVLAELFAPCKDQSFAGGPLQLQESHQGSLHSYAKGLAVHSQTTLQYRLAGEYQRFTAQIGIDPEANGLGHVVLRIICDDKVIFEQPVESSVATPISVELQGAQQLEIVVDFGEGQDLGDRLHLADARLYR